MTQPNIFQEIEQDLEHQRLEELWRKFGPYVLGFAAVLILATAGYTYFRNSNVARDQKATQALMQLFDAKANEAEVTPVSLEDFAKQYSGKTQATFALLKAASLEAKAGHIDAAVGIYDAVANDSKNDKVFRQLAQLLSVDTQMDSADPAALQAKLQPLMASDAIWHAKAVEDSAFLALKIGDKDAARKGFTELAQDASIPHSMAQRAQDMLNYIGN